MKVWVVTDEHFGEVANVCAAKQTAYQKAREVIMDSNMDADEKAEAENELRESYLAGGADLFFVTGIVSAEAMTVE